MIKIILVEDHLVVRNGIKLLLDTQDNVKVIGEANNGVEALDLLKSTELPDVILTDITMPEMDGLQLAKIMQQEYPEVKVIVLSMLNSIENMKSAFEFGCKGFLIKNVSYDELLFGINHISRGGHYICEELVMSLMKTLLSQDRLTPKENVLFEEGTFTDRELEVLQLISDGFTNVQIADKLFLSKRTVEGHRQNLIEKMDVKNSASLIKYATLHGLVK